MLKGRSGEYYRHVLMCDIRCSHLFHGFQDDRWNLPHSRSLDLQDAGVKGASGFDGTMSSLSLSLILPWLIEENKMEG